MLRPADLHPTEQIGPWIGHAVQGGGKKIARLAENLGVVLEVVMVPRRCLTRAHIFNLPTACAPRRNRLLGACCRSAPPSRHHSDSELTPRRPTPCNPAAGV